MGQKRNYNQYYREPVVEEEGDRTGGAPKGSDHTDGQKHLNDNERSFSLRPGHSHQRLWRVAFPQAQQEKQYQTE